MPFLRAGLKANDNVNVVKVSKPATASDNVQRVFPPPEIVSSQKSSDSTLSLFPSDIGDIQCDGTHNSNDGNSNKKKGTRYERYIGSIYEEYGYIVDYNGIKKNGHDRGVDLICHNNRYTVLVQCKCYSSGSISVNTIYQFFGSSRHYAVKHPNEVVSSSLWTSLTLKNNNEAFIAAEELGIRIYQGYKLP